MHLSVLRLESFGLNYREMQGDGLSLFRALAIELGHGEDNLAEVQEEHEYYRIQNKDRFSLLLKMSTTA